MRSLVLCSVVCAACAGTPPRAEEPVTRPEPVVEDTSPRLAAGANHSCVRLPGGRVACWGANDHGQLGDGTRIDRGRPVAVPSVGGATQLAAGMQHTCALTGDGQVLCWGAGLYGQLGDGGEGEEHEASVTPARVEGIENATQIAAGYLHTCAVHGGRLS
ncbi:MAG: RCC1 repeat-containing protein, partial [Sandaracinaceae bacterium]|nr:RCC1 repeat-containing protein [Sandaracinaceae bacterium]